MNQVFASILSRKLYLGSSLAAIWMAMASPVWAGLPSSGVPSHLGSEKGLVAQSQEESAKEEEESEFKPFNEVVKDARKIEGLFTLYHHRNTGKLYLEIQPEQLNRNFLCVMTLATGIGEAGLFRGMPISDILVQFRRVQNRVQLVVPNVNFRARPGDPVERSLSRAFSDSTLISVPIQSIHPTRKTLLIDFGEVLTRRDLPGIAPALASILGAPYLLDPESSSLGTVEAFPLNVELEAVYRFTSAGNASTSYLPSLPDSRAFNLAVHYSFSELPVSNGYRPRLADERVGYFVTAYKDFSNDSRRDPFVRYINRWHLEKQDPNAPLSPPKEPIVFWIENTVPVEYRDAIQEGVVMWNRAFEQAGFLNAIEVRQMPDDADWNPADIRYNTIRWSATFDSGFLGLGPSRVNPLTGQILDADILIDADVVRFIRREYRTFSNSGNSESLVGATDARHPCTSTLQQLYLRGTQIPQLPTATDVRWPFPGVDLPELCLKMESTRQFSMGAIAMTLLHSIPPSSTEMDKFVNQYLSYLIAHEVGHTLGLRHNFHGSTLLAPEELNNLEMTRTRGMVSSVMDYVPVNLAPPGVEQGDYFPVIVGPYDRWAIEYGYKPFNAPNPVAELPYLRQIAQRSGEPELAYAADEDTLAGLDPAANWYDLSNNMLVYSQWQLENAQAMWSRLNRRTPIAGESYSEMRDMFHAVFVYYFQHAMNISLYVGGQSFSRNFAGDGRLPFEAISATKQRQALQTLNQYVFAADAFEFTPQLLNQLAPSRWWHWGTVPIIFPLEYPIGDRIFLLQQIVLRNLLSPVRLSRLRDMELKAEPGKEVLALPELFETLQTGIWTEVVDRNASSRDITSIRRALQREYVEVLIEMVLKNQPVPEDARTLAWYNLHQLRDRINVTLRRSGNLDVYTQAHLAQTRDRINKALEAPLLTR
ncbi:zinc-dependent metalloprotease [Desertifilum sp. FACHB-1129]|uniref:Peptidase M43 n=2 Tax=Desertifilum tharense IPPAS B-1220 TaxID=1781255 RepID=A0A1E5QHP8_9CYAN|nr:MULTISPECIES: zinc-dependent metalloprotease [Desertifilum]MDA0209635.1 zinc-dependent metalloprotease [Cyanobacteria bacterium FC1]MBD2313045.1 zinc-dependent metalloprotease [Desertifilum sp. FACHB-1129]MBD2320909.1 zinc-dependent metalloprotease [Desertifilum sp. FACHB-866]MBD2331038.1 zinc-dependent metalloprotease [Desertifilum sp. FACHB-868]OEJ73853.1 peptidase M43 [Desertifilum tharense IPPAS B-1220]